MNHSLPKTAYPRLFQESAEPATWPRYSSPNQPRSTIGYFDNQAQQEVDHLLDDTLTEAAGLARNDSEVDVYAGSF